MIDCVQAIREQFDSRQYGIGMGVLVSAKEEMEYQVVEYAKQNGIEIV